MKTTTLARPLPLLAALFLALSLVLACGDDDSLSGYFTDLQRIFEDAEDATNEAEEQLDDAATGAALDEQISALDTYLGEIDTIFSEATGRLEGLDVPAAAADDHQDFIDGVQVSVNAGNALRDDLQDISTGEQLDDRLAKFDSDVDAAVDKADAACLGLQQIADAENIDVDLDCED